MFGRLLGAVLASSSLLLAVSACSSPVDAPVPDSQIGAVGASAAARGAPSEDTRRIVMTVDTAGAQVAPVAKINALSKDTRTQGIVVGRVASVKDVCIEGAGYRILTISVSAVPKGAKAGQIRVIEDGGIVPASCLKEVLDGKFGQPFQAAEGDYVDFQTEGHPHTPVGAEVVAFVSEQRANPWGATHQLVGGLQGLFVRSGDHFTRSVLDTPEARAAGIEASLPVVGAAERLAAAVRG